MTYSLGSEGRAWVAALLGATFGLVACLETASLGAGPEGAGGEAGTGETPPSTAGTSTGSVGGGLVGAGGGAANGAVAGGSGGTGGDIHLSAGTGGTEPSCDVEEVLRRSCGRVGCHSEKNRIAGLDLASPGVQTRLIDVSATHQDITCPNPDGGVLKVPCIPAACPDAKLIDLADPEESWLLKKLAGTQGECGAQMPLAPGMLSESERTCLEEWLYPHPPVVR